MKSSHLNLSFITLAILVALSCLLNTVNIVDGAPNKQKQSSTCGVLQIIPGDVRTISPWSAAIFVSGGKGKPPKFYTNGVIIGPSTVVSIAGGPYGVTLRGRKSSNYTIPSAEIFLIGAGINSTDFSTHDNFAQFSGVSFIEPYRNHDYSNEHYHYFIYHLKTPLNFQTPYVKEICIPLILKNRSQSPYGWQLVQAGFAQSGTGTGTGTGTGDKNSPNLLKAWKVTTGPHKLCQSVCRYHYKRELEQAHLFCSRRDVMTTKRGSPFAKVVDSVDLGVKDSHMCHMHGASLAFEIGNTWYLPTMVALIPGKGRGRCSHKSFYMYGNFVSTLDWVFASYTCSPNKFACNDKSCIPLEKVCNNVNDCPDGWDEDETFCAAQNVCSRSRGGNATFSCGIGQGCIEESKKCDKQPDCPISNSNPNFNPADESPKLCVSNERPGVKNSGGGVGRSKSGRGKNCPEIPLYEGMTASCIDLNRNSKIDCTGANFPGVEMKIQCDEFSVPHFGYDSIQMTCNSEGDWIGQKPFSCDQECGTIRSGDDQFSPKILPWHASIYISPQGQHQLKCSATLIEKSFLLTSASCVNSWLTNPADKQLFKVLLTPMSTETNVNLLSASLQVFPVKQVWTSATATVANTVATSDGSLSKSSDSEIAIIELQSGAETAAGSRANKPKLACYIQSFRKVKPGKIGLVSGFGIRDGVFADPIKVVNVTVVPNEECQNVGINISPDEGFCTTGASFCKSDIGGGFFSPEKSGDKIVYILKGIATPAGSANCNSSTTRNKYQWFSSTDLYSDWILDVLESSS